MLNRTGLFRAYRVLLIFGVTLAAGQAMNAQTVGNAAAKPAQPVSASPVEPAVNFADVVRVVEQQGRSTTIGSYIAEAVGLKSTQTDSSPVQAHAVGGGDRELCVIEDSDALLFLIGEGENTMVYLANRAGALKMAGYFHPGRFHSQDFKEVSKQKAAAGFAAEKNFWLRSTFPSRYTNAAQTPEPVSKPENARVEPVAKPTKKVAPKESKQGAAAATAPAASTAATADYDPEKLRQMTPKERIKYLDQQIEEAKRQEKLEKKQKEKAKKSAEKDSQAAPANAEGEAAPPKKKVSWF